MTFTDAIRNGFENYAKFDGRAPRREYWFWVLFVVLASIAASVIDTAVTQGILGVVIGLGLFIPNLAVSVRRLHDIGKSGWNLLWGLVPLLGFIYLIYLYVQPGDPATNEYGPAPA
jgi:uncharacterized membrane protein YhaH (DUF805 family)